MTSLTVLPIEEAARLPGELCEGLFPERMKRAAKLRYREDIYRSIAAGALTALVLGAKEAELTYNPWGKPIWTGGDLCFSLSHSGGYALLAVDETEVGTDIEKNVPVSRGVAERVLTDEELLWMRDESSTRFLPLWTLKESVMKLDGRGFSLSPQSFSVLPLIYGDSILSERGKIYGYTTPFHDCTLSVCTLHPMGEPLIQVLTADELLKKIK